MDNLVIGETLITNGYSITRIENAVYCANGELVGANNWTVRFAIERVIDHVLTSTKVCTGCQKRLSLDAFYVVHRAKTHTIYRNACKECFTASRQKYNTEYWTKNRERMNAYQRAVYDPEQRRHKGRGDAA